ncbi:hypothetical protein ACFWV1_11025 [Streptomyces sp. NPDC058700]|uniref:hypothetical protein n=1 Tax=Streptomyces sp. NPDC058700 TaxID=3346607 RepID=UPI00365F1C57
MSAYPSKDDALRGAREVADLADWTLTGAELQDRRTFDPEEYLQRMQRVGVRSGCYQTLGFRLSRTARPTAQSCFAAKSSTSMGRPWLSTITTQHTSGPAEATSGGLAVSIKSAPSP